MTTRTRPKTLSASRRKRRPELECLEEKKVLSTVFGAYSSGETWAFNDQAGWREINSAVPIAMKEGTDGTLFASYNSGPRLGTWRYDYGSNNWTGITGAVASVLSASQSDNTLFASFSGGGTWEFNGIWHQLASHDATMLAAVSNNDVYASLTGTRTGTWHYNNGWNQLTTAVPIAMDASPDGAMYASYSDGTYNYQGWSDLFDSGWTKVTSKVATQIAAINDLSFVGSFVDGTDEYTGGFCYTVTTDVYTHLGHSGSTIIGSDGSGTFTYQGLSGNPVQQIDWFNPAIQFG
jgi:hypothetical protein